MKHILQILATAFLLAACNTQSKPELDTKKDVIVTDTSAMYRSNLSTDTGSATVSKPVPPPVTTTRTITRTRTVYVDRTPKAIQRKSIPQAASSGQVTTIPNPVTQTQPQTNTPIGSGAGTTTQTSGAGTTTTTGAGKTTTVPAAKPVPQDRGMSSATKDAVIGGVGGAIGGAVISKKKGKGALIGGIIGAAGGYIIGRKKDKQDTAR